MLKEKEYIVATLKKAGIKTPIFTSMKKLKGADGIQIGAVLCNSEKYIRSNSKRKFTQDGIRKVRHKKFDKETNLRIVIGESSEEKCEEILEQFLILVGDGVADAHGNWISIEIGEADWVESGDSILKAKIAVQLDIVCKGGIYKDVGLKEVEIDGIGTVKGGLNDATK